jgi:hypothetical protein
MLGEKSFVDQKYMQKVKLKISTRLFFLEFLLKEMEYFILFQSKML